MPWDAFLDKRRQLEGIGAGQNSAPGLCFINCAQVQRAACSACNREARSAVWLITKKLAVVVDFMLNYLSKETTTKTLPQPQPQPQQRDWRLPLSCPVSAAAHPSKQSLLLPPSPAPQCRPQLQLSPQIYGCHLNFYEFLNADLLWHLLLQQPQQLKPAPDW